jgi:hypothetical protein
MVGHSAGAASQDGRAAQMIARAAGDDQKDRGSPDTLSLTPTNPVRRK